MKASKKRARRASREAIDDAGPVCALPGCDRIALYRVVDQPGVFVCDRDYLALGARERAETRSREIADKLWAHNEDALTFPQRMAKIRAEKRRDRRGQIATSK